MAELALFHKMPFANSNETPAPLIHVPRGLKCDQVILPPLGEPNVSLEHQNIKLNQFTSPHSHTIKSSEEWMKILPILSSLHTYTLHSIFLRVKHR